MNHEDFILDTKQMSTSKQFTDDIIDLKHKYDALYDMVATNYAYTIKQLSEKDEIINALKVKNEELDKNYTGLCTVLRNHTDVIKKYFG